MKRSGNLKRKTPIARGEIRLERGAPMRRTWMKRRSPKRIEERKHMKPYRDFVQALPCVHCSRRAPSDPAHVATGPGQKAKSLKVDDRQVVPLCRSCHRFFDGNADGPTNPFRGKSIEDKWTLAAGWVERTQLAATPEDRDAALTFEQMGLGRIVGDALSWHWVPVGSEVAA